jgi:hypothetical protein
MVDIQSGLWMSNGRRHVGAMEQLQITDDLPVVIGNRLVPVGPKPRDG